MAFGGFLKPEYLLRPRNVAARLRYRDPRRLPETITLQFAGRPFRIRPHEVIGRQILHFGLFDLLVSETLLRLADPGELAVDLGANIGAMARVLARAVGSAGRVVAFEPMLELYDELMWNCTGLPIEARRIAVSDHSGTARLAIPPDFGDNRGIASLEPADSATASLPVPVTTLDLAFPAETIGVMKIDIEGHELAALQGATRLLAERRVRDIVFEDHHPRSSPTARFLADSGYRVFRLQKRFLGPRLVAPDSQMVDSTWESPALLATREPERAKARLAPRGWRALREL